MVIAAVIQARMGSSRLPGKVLKPLFQNQLALHLMLDRVKRAVYLDHIIVATSDLKADDAIQEACDIDGVQCFRGSESNVLERFYQAIQETIPPVTHIMRLTADCPLHDPEIIDECIKYYQKHPCDYLSNTVPRTFPKGLDIEIMTRQALERAYQNAGSSYEKEHVTPYIKKHPNLFTLGNFQSKQDLSNHRWTLDYPEDYQMITRVYQVLYPDNPTFGWAEVIQLLKTHPEIYNINAHLE